MVTVTDLEKKNSTQQLYAAFTFSYCVNSFHLCFKAKKINCSDVMVQERLSVK